MENFEGREPSKQHCYAYTYNHRRRISRDSAARITEREMPSRHPQSERTEAPQPYSHATLSSEEACTLEGSQLTRPLIVQLLNRLAIAAILVLAILYAGDYALARHRMNAPQHANELGSVEIVPMYEIPHKDGREEIIVGDASQQPCIHSLFPHFGYPPCWYLKRNQPKPSVY
jgi:hypothetical protein